jgi:hypothetical protein
MKHIRLRLALLPWIPLVGAALKHYGPDWVDPGIWVLSSILAVLAFGLSFFPWEDM